MVVMCWKKSRKQCVVSDTLVIEVKQVSMWGHVNGCTVSVLDEVQ